MTLLSLGMQCKFWVFIFRTRAKPCGEQGPVVRLLQWSVDELVVC